MPQQRTPHAREAQHQLIRELEGRVRTQLGGRVRDLRFVLDDHGLVLRGRTDSYYVKQLAQHAVLKFAEVRLLANEIEVTADRPSSEPVE